MVVLLFILGCPGSGKSTVSRHISDLASSRGWATHSINDYGILYSMYLKDTNYEKFSPVAYDGFKVLDASVYNEALVELKEQTEKFKSDFEKNEIVVIEFSRYEYKEALNHFGYEFLHKANFLYLDADLDICIRRVNQRIVQRHSLDDHFVPKNVIACHCQKSNMQYIESGLKIDYGINSESVRVLDSGGSLEELMQQVELFIDMILPPVPVPIG